jgi:putative hemolysin
MLNLLAEYCKKDGGSLGRILQKGWRLSWQNIAKRMAALLAEYCKKDGGSLGRILQKGWRLSWQNIAKRMAALLAEYCKKDGGSLGRILQKGWQNLYHHVIVLQLTFRESSIFPTGVSSLHLCSTLL